MEAITSSSTLGKAYSEAQDSTQSITDVFNRELEKRKSDLLESENSLDYADMQQTHWQPPLPALLAKSKGQTRGNEANALKINNYFHNTLSSESEVGDGKKISMLSVRDNFSTKIKRTEISMHSVRDNLNANIKSAERLAVSIPVQTLVNSNVTEPLDVKLLTSTKHGMQASSVNNLNVVVKNKGHDFLLSTPRLSTNEVNSLNISSKVDNSVTVFDVSHKAKGELVEQQGLADTTNVITSQSDPQLSTKPLVFSTQSPLSLADTKPVDVKNITMPDSQNLDKGTLTYRFQRWGGEHSVNIQSQLGGSITLQPSDGIVEQKLNEQWLSGNPQRWQLAQDGGKQQQNQHQHQQNEEEEF